MSNQTRMKKPGGRGRVRPPGACPGSEPGMDGPSPLTGKEDPLQGHVPGAWTTPGNSFDDSRRYRDDVPDRTRLDLFAIGFVRSGK